MPSVRFYKPPRRRAPRARMMRQPRENDSWSQVDRALFPAADMQSIVDQLEQRLTRTLLAKLAVQPLQQFGAALGGETAGALSGLFDSGGAYDFQPSRSQVASLFGDWIGQAEDLF
ncbi:MAG: hypothetical protein WDO70_04205 [Alphaproteobacteria bacterium]